MKTQDAVTNSETVSKRSITPGAGVDPQRVLKLGKRVRNLHRRAAKHKYQALRDWCFTQIQDGTQTPMSTAWLCTRFLQAKGVVS